MTDVPRATLASRVRSKPWAYSFGFAAVVLTAQVVLLIGQRPASSDLPTLAPAWQEYAIIPVAFFLTALTARVVIAAVVLLTTRRRAGA